MIILVNSQWEGSSHWDSLGMFQIYYVRHQEINSTAMPVRVIDQKIRLHEPIVTNKLKLTVVKSAKPMVFKIQLLGTPADKKYQADPMLDKKTFHNCKLQFVKKKALLFNVSLAFPCSLWLRCSSWLPKFE